MFQDIDNRTPPPPPVFSSGHWVMQTGFNSFGRFSAVYHSINPLHQISTMPWKWNGCARARSAVQRHIKCSSHTKTCIWLNETKLRTNTEWIQRHGTTHTHSLIYMVTNMEICWKNGVTCRIYIITRNTRYGRLDFFSHLLSKMFISFVHLLLKKTVIVNLGFH